MTTLDMNLLTPSPKQQLLPMISRLDRLDRLLLYLEERRHLSERRSVDSLPTKIEQSRPLSSALEEINFIGTLIERIGNLENRVFQLSIEMEEGSTSSSSTIPTSGINVHEKGHRDPAPALDRNQNKVTIEVISIWAWKYQKYYYHDPEEKVIHQMKPTMKGDCAAFRRKPLIKCGHVRPNNVPGKAQDTEQLCQQGMLENGWDGLKWDASALQLYSEKSTWGRRK